MRGTPLGENTLDDTEKSAKIPTKFPAKSPSPKSKEKIHRRASAGAQGEGIIFVAYLLSEGGWQGDVPTHTPKQNHRESMGFGAPSQIVDYTNWSSSTVVLRKS